MADLSILPTWAIHYIEETLKGHTHLINALPIDKGRSKGAFLLNTSQGAVLLEKPRGGEPRHWYLPLPAAHYAFTCHVCMERIEFVDPEVPRTVYCTHCGTRYRLFMEAGTVALRRDGERGEPAPAKEEPKPTPSAPAPPKPASGGPFRHGDYTLYERQTATKGGGQTTFYFFAKNTPKSGRPAAKPDGYVVEVNERTKLPYLRRSDKERVEPGSQCGAYTADGKQCRRTAAAGKAYCHVHKAYKPISKAELARRTDTAPKSKKAADTLPGAGDRGPKSDQCAALTADGKQCRNNSRAGSKYCTRHKGHRPSTGARSLDTKPVGRRVKDTKPKSR